MRPRCRLTLSSESLYGDSDTNGFFEDDSCCLATTEGGWERACGGSNLTVVMRVGVRDEIKHNTAQRCPSRLWFTRTELLLLIVLGSRAVTPGEGHCRGGKPRQPHVPRLPDTCPLCLFKHLLMAPHSAPIEPFLLLSRCHKESNEKTERSREWWRPIRCTCAINTGSLHYTTKGGCLPNLLT